MNIQRARRFVGRTQDDRSGLRPAFRSDSRQCRVPSRAMPVADTTGQAQPDLDI